jgi:hypothetical protein
MWLAGYLQGASVVVLILSDVDNFNSTIIIEDFVATANVVQKCEWACAGETPFKLRV